MKIFSPILKGTTTVAQGTTNLSGSFTGSLFGTAATASYADNFTVGGTLTAQTINVQIITSSIEFNTGSTRNGALSTNTHQFTGSVLVSGSLSVTGSAAFSSDVTTGGKILISDGGNATIPCLKIGSATTGISQNVSEQLNFITNSTTKMIISSSGNVGIGTTSPSNILHVAQSNTGNIGIAIQNTNASYAAQVRFLNAAGSEKAAVTYVQSASALRFNNNTYDAIEITSGGGVDLYNPTTIGKNTNAGSCIGFTENQIYRTGNGVLYLQEYSTNHIIALNGGGNFLIGTSTNLGYRLFANGTAAGLSNWNNVSDGRLKKDVTPVINGLDKIKQLSGVYFNWDKTLRPDLNLDTNNHLGLIAQDVEEILPQVVTTGDDEFGTKTIAYSDIVPVLIEAIKELSAENDTLKEILQRNNIQ